MVATIQGYPFAQTAGQGLFAATADGLVQGTAYPDPADRYALRQSILSQSETLPMYGGVGLYAFVPTNVSISPARPSSAMGSIVGRATGITGSFPLFGFSVFDQNYAMVNFPSNPVPIQGSGGGVFWYPFYSDARIAVQCSPNLVNLRGTPINQSLAWDFTNQQLEPYSSTTLSALTSYVSATGVVTVTTAAPHGFNPGDTFNIAGVTGTGANLSALNGVQTALAGTAGSTLVFAVATGLTITTVTGGTIDANNLLPATVRILDVQIGNSMTVSGPANGLYSWNYAGNCAIIQI